MIPPRWHKVLADFWSNKARSILVVASIAVGLFAIGIIATGYAVILDDMRLGYASVHPANLQIQADPFGQDFVDSVKHLKEVQDAEGVRIASLRLQTSPGEWTGISIQAFSNFKKMNINQVTLEQGSWPPGDHQIAIERNKLPDTNAHLGDWVNIELPDGKTCRLKLVGVVHDQTVGASSIGGGFFLAPVQGYVNENTLECLELPDSFNELYVTVKGNSNDETHLNQVAASVRKEVEDSGRLVINTVVRRSDDHPNSTYVEAIAGVLFLLGLMVVFLSGFLITNTLSALMNQQIQQIGVMKAVGARRYQIISLYMALIFVFGVLAFVLAVPLSDVASNALLEYLAQKINFTLQSHRIVPGAIALQLVIALVIPQVAGFLPILYGSRITVQEAVSGFSQSAGPRRKSRFDRWLESLRGMSRPMIISLRNTFRRKGRLVLTLITLSMGGAIFIATFNVRASLNQHIEQIGKYFLADVNLTFDRPYRLERIQQELSDLSGVAHVEGWAQARAELLLANDKTGDSVSLLGPPADSPLVQPILLSGRWIQPGDQNDIVLSELFHSRFPGIRVGDSIRLKVNGKNTSWVVVGFFQLAGKSGGFLAYVPYSYLSKQISLYDKASTFRIVASTPGLSEEAQKQLGKEIEAHLRQSGYRITDLTTGRSLSTSASKGLNVLTIFLLIMAVLTALVGSIGLMGTMSMNVMERTREIGVMRSIGASDSTLMSLVIVEGMIIGLISWVIGSLLAFPISKVMSDTISLAIFDSTSSLTLTLAGFAIWLGMVMSLSILASSLPANNARRLTIREVLAYE